MSGRAAAWRFQLRRRGAYREGYRAMRRLQKYVAAAFGLWLWASAATPAMAAADPLFQKWLAELWPQAQAMGVSRRTFDAATAGVEPDMTLPDLEIPGRPGVATPRPGRVRADAGRLHQRGVHRAAGRAGQEALRSTPARSRRSNNDSACPATCCWRSGAARLRSVATSCPKTQSRCWRRRAITAAARRCLRRNCLCPQDAR